jgi:hypothetical protein
MSLTLFQCKVRTVSAIFKKMAMFNIAFVNP